jgi:hypothetical protein
VAHFQIQVADSNDLPFLIPWVRAQQYLISTLAGAVPALTPSKALGASVIPALVASDGAGNIYFATGYVSGDVVYKIDTSGILTRVAGTARPPSSEPLDGSIAANTPLSVFGLVCDAAGNVYISDGKRVPKELSRNNISIEKCFSVHWLQWLTLLRSPLVLLF